MALTEPEGRDHMLELCIRESGKGNLAAQEVLMERYGFSERIQGNLPRAPTDEPKPDWADWREVLEALMVALEKGRYRAPYAIQDFGEAEATVPCLALRLSDVAAHFNARRSLPGPVSGRILKRQLREAGAIFRDRVDVTIAGERECHLVALSLAAMESYGLTWPGDLSQ